MNTAGPSRDPRISASLAPPPLPPSIERSMAFIRFEGALITILNPSDVESLPGIPNSDPPYNLQGRELRHAIWVTERCPELAYMLRSYDMESAFLARIHLDPKHAPIVRVEGGYALDPAVRQGWEELEQRFLWVSNYLLDLVSSRPEAKFPLDPFWPLPSECGYKNVHRDPHRARIAVAKSLDAARALLARTSLAIALATPVLSATPPLWVSALREAKVPDVWIDFVRQSVVADFSPGLRVGAYINPSLTPNGTQWVTHIPTMVRANVPVYIVWPPGDLSPILARYPFLQDFVPDPRFARDVPGRRDGAWRAFFRWDTLPPPSTSTAPPPPDMSRLPIPHGPGQLPGEDPFAFLARRQAANRELEAQEQPAARATRLARALHAQSFERPTRKSRTTVYLWNTVGDHDATVPDEWLELDYRELIGHARLHDLWQVHPNSQKHYDPWRDEWDIIPKLAPGEERTEQDDDEEDVYDELEQRYLVSTPPLPEPLPSGTAEIEPEPVATAIPPQMSSDVLAASFESDLRFYYDQDDINYVPYAQSLQAVARHRFGLVSAYVAQAPLNWTALDASALRKIIGYLTSDFPDDEDTQVLVKSLSAFIEPMLANATNPQPPALLWDLDSEHPTYLLGGVFRHPSIVVERVRLNGSVWYRISYQTDGDSCWWDLILKSGIAAIELMRQRDITSRRAAATYMVTRGMPFNTIFQPDRRDSRTLGPDPRVVLGWRSCLDLTLYDYRVYEDRVRTMLRGSRARAALLHGGIVWRLALEVIGAERIDEATWGPSQAAYDYATVFRPVRGDDYLDDKLSSDELDVLCGVYKVFVNSGQTEDRSWWPKANIWDSSPFDLGYWTPWCEAWFLKRLNRVRTGEAKIYNAAGWQRALRQAKNAPIFRNALERASNNWLLDQYKVCSVDM